MKRMIMMTRNTFLLFLSGLLCVACNDWLNVKPLDKMTEEQLYRTKKGYETALNGLYLNLADPSLYGENLSCGFTDVLGQLYRVPDGHLFQQTAGYNYTHKEVKDRLESIWTNAYAMIVNCNLLSYNLQQYKGVLSEAEENLFMGEVCALRAFMHFELFRLFGPVYTDETKAAVSIPYYDHYAPSPGPLLTSEAVIAKTMQDIDLALEFLRHDPVVEKGVVRGDGYWDYRNFRMNYYAVWALKARVCLHTGQKDEAFRISAALLAGEDPATQTGNNFIATFPFVNPTLALTASNPDRVFFPEILFGIHNLKRNDLKTNLFSIDLTDQKILTASENFIKKIFVDENLNDLRFVQLWNITPGDNKQTLFKKFDPVTLEEANPYRGEIQAMFRLGELYLIAAEAASDDNQRTFYLEKLREGRKYLVNNTDNRDLTLLLRDENIREFYGEGQFFYFMKRNRMEKITTQLGKDVNMTGKYALPLPDSEVNNRYE